jgi:hypothetical protein
VLDIVQGNGKSLRNKSKFVLHSVLGTKEHRISDREISPRISLGKSQSELEFLYLTSLMKGYTTLALLILGYTSPMSF